MDGSKKKATKIKETGGTEIAAQGPGAAWPWGGVISFPLDGAPGQ